MKKHYYSRNFLLQGTLAATNRQSWTIWVLLEEKSLPIPTLRSTAAMSVLGTNNVLAQIFSRVPRVGSSVVSIWTMTWCWRGDGRRPEVCNMWSHARAKVRAAFVFTDVVKPGRLWMTMRGCDLLFWITFENNVLLLHVSVFQTKDSKTGKPLPLNSRLRHS